MLREIIDSYIEKYGEVVAVSFVGGTVNNVWISFINSELIKVKFNGKWEFILNRRTNLNAQTKWMIEDCKTYLNIINAPSNMMIDAIIEYLCAME